MIRAISIALLVALLSGCAGQKQLVGERPPLTPRQNDAAMKALLGPDEFAEYVAITDTAAAAEWLRRFWQKHDPTPTTPQNEFRDEHERRVYHAIYLFGHSQKGGPPWDDRGEVYIRYGQPDERVIRQLGSDHEVTAPTDAAGDVFGNLGLSSGLNKPGAATEIWNYYRWNQTFQFEDKRGFGFFTLAPVTDPEYKRQDVGQFYSTKLRAIDLQPAIYYHEYGKSLIDYALDVVRFQGDHGDWRVDVNLGYPLTELGRDSSDSATISIRRTLLIRNEQQREAYSEVGLIRRLVGRPDSANRLMVEQKVIDLPPGLYSLAVTIDDLCAGKSGTYVKTFRLPQYIVPEVQEISDIELASYVWSIYEPGSPFVKKGRMIVPLPSRIYLPQQPLAFYFEVYHLLLGEDGQTRYTVDYDVSAVGEKIHHKLPGSGELSGSERRVAQFGTLDLTGIPSGDYILTVTVSDLVGHHDQSSIARFTKSD